MDIAAATTVDIRQFAAREIAAINQVFREHQVRAGTGLSCSMAYDGAFLAYGIKREPGVLVSAVEKLHPELIEAISRLRRRTTAVRLRYAPLALEVAHPTPKPLDWRAANLLGKWDTMLIGRNYSDGEPRDETLSFDSQPHALIAGTTGSGKSTLMRMALCSLTMRTDPDALRLYIVDMKNDDLRPFRALPHTEAFAYELDTARSAVRAVYAELKRRVNNDDMRNGPRIVLAIDELAELADPDSLGMLNSILRIGRSYRVNVLAATQRPTKATCGETANYTVRLVGTVTTANEAAIAAGRGQTGAELLPGRGAFLWIEGNRADRLQAYHLDMDGTAALVASVRQRWPGRDGVVEHRQPVPVYQYSESPILAADWPVPQRALSASTSGTGTVQPVQVVQPTFPIGDRALMANEVEAVRRMHANGVSKNKILDVVYGGKTPKRFAWVTEAIEGGAA